LLAEAEDRGAGTGTRAAIFDGLLGGKIGRSLLTPGADAFFTPQMLEEAAARIATGLAAPPIIPNFALAKKRAALSFDL
jgi:hypothetical protein